MLKGTKHGPTKTHCVHGHLRTLENVSSNGSCIQCSSAASIKHKKQYPEKTKLAARIAARKWRKENPEAAKSAQQKKLYGITLAEKEAQTAKQENKCAICHIEFDEAQRPETDHDHTTKRVRGQLCRACNTLLGQAKDNTETLSNAIQYLNKFREII